MASEIVSLNAYKLQRMRREAHEYRRELLRAYNPGESDTELDRIARLEVIRSRLEWEPPRLTAIPAQIAKIQARIVGRVSTNGRTKGQPLAPSTLAGLRSRARTLERYARELAAEHTRLRDEAAVLEAQASD